ncbi:MAG TPA: MlaD family protein [Nitrospiria bacterium]|nr:MlaD family protein [Nitrospiria bacterium]
MADRDAPPYHIPESRTLARKKTGLSLVWIIPIVAAIIGAWVAVVKIMEEGPKITISIRSAEGLEAGKTKIRYNGVDIGTITSIRLTDDHKRVIATASMAPKTEAFFVEDTKFWVVSPRISGASVSGLGTLISGSYIGLEIGKSPNKQSAFTALPAPPLVTGDVAGRFFVLKTTDLGSVDYGTPIYFRRLKVGEVVSYELDKDGKTLTVKIFVNAPYDQFVTAETRFWQASGIDVSLSASGVSVQTQSVLSMLVGGLAFETPDAAQALPQAAANTEFTLYGNRAEAYKPPPTYPTTYLLVFNQSIRGLKVGAPVEFRGIQIGEVTDVQAEIDLKTFELSVVVTVSADPQRLGVKVRGQGATAADRDAAHRKLIDALVSRGLRAQLQTGSLITGALFVELDFFPDAPPFMVDWSQSPIRLATIPGKLEGIEANIASLVKKLDQVPYQEIGQDLRKTMADVDQTLDSAHRTLDHADTLIESNSGLNQELTNALREVDGAARSLRVLSDYLERHPEALIRGKAEEKK